MINYKITEPVEIDDPLSMYHECTGLVSEILENGIIEVSFEDNSSAFFEQCNLIQL